MISQKEIVVAKYNEDLTWLDSLNDGKVTIYNKGDGDLSDGVKLPNIGREPQTYFYHIVNNYNNLSEWTFFTQGRPFDHVKNFVEIINNWSVDKPNTINVQDKGFFFSNGVFSKPLKSFSNGRPYHTSILNIDELWSSLFTCEPPTEYEFTAGCIFCLHKDLILSRDVEFYKKCLNLSETVEDSPWEFERMIQYIFNNKFK